MKCLQSLEEELKDMRIKHDNFSEDYKVGFNVAVGRILLIVNELIKDCSHNHGDKNNG